MRMKEWLAKTGTTQAAFAEILGVRRETVIRWCADDHIPDMATMLRIQEATKGGVAVVDWADVERRRAAIKAAEEPAQP